MADLKNMESTEILKNIADKREALRTERFGAAGSRSRNVREAREIRKDIARFLTELRARDIAARTAEIAAERKDE